MKLLSWLFIWHGRISGQQYFLAGFALTVLKYAIDHTVAAHFGEPWQLWDYLIPNWDRSLFQLGYNQPEMYAALWTIAIPFFWIGVALTLKRLNDSGHSPRWIFLFFLPFLNIFLFVWMCLTPSAPAGQLGSRALPASEAKADSRVLFTFIGIAIGILLGVLFVTLGTRYLMGYGWGLFLGLPFIVGFITSWFQNFRTVRSKSTTISTSVLTIFLLGLALIGVRIEGLICLMMALPLSLPFSIAGALFARYLLNCDHRKYSPSTFTAGLAILPLIMFGEHAANLEPPVLSVTTSVIIEAPVSTVWTHVVAFPPLAEPDELIFRTGIAYPTSAEIVGSGLGAVRYCRFSTGDFVEPITIWDENHLLAFNVTAQPQSMRELSPWKISTPHLEHNYMRSKHGQFRLVALSDHRTLLEGTTWYQNYFCPQPYWRAWSDGIVHRIHMRVLRHVKELSEAH
jgi:uncharacterized membrane protein YhaH (DUF805 family)